MPDEWCLKEFDHLSPELAPVLPDALARMRTLCPVTHSEKHGGFWVVTKYGDVLNIAQDWATFSSAHGLGIPPSTTHVRNIPVEVEPPEQRVYKRLINTYFTPKSIAPWEKPVEELLRLDPPFIAIARTATRDVEVGGKQIAKGDRVLIYWASANHDSDEFSDPDTFDLDRSTNRNLAFGAGPHRCLGSNVARLNLRVANVIPARVCDTPRHVERAVFGSPLLFP